MCIIQLSVKRYYQVSINSFEAKRLVAKSCITEHVSLVLEKPNQWERLKYPNRTVNWLMQKP